MTEEKCIRTVIVSAIKTTVYYSSRSGTTSKMLSGRLGHITALRALHIKTGRSHSLCPLVSVNLVPRVSDDMRTRLSRCHRPPRPISLGSPHPPPPPPAWCWFTIPPPFLFLRLSSMSTSYHDHTRIFFS